MHHVLKFFMLNFINVIEFDISSDFSFRLLVKQNNTLIHIYGEVWTLILSKNKGGGQLSANLTNIPFEQD